MCDIYGQTHVPDDSLDHWFIGVMGIPFGYPLLVYLARPIMEKAQESNSKSSRLGPCKTLAWLHIQSQARGAYVGDRQHRGEVTCKIDKRDPIPPTATPRKHTYDHILDC